MISILLFSIAGVFLIFANILLLRRKSYLPYSWKIVATFTVILTILTILILLEKGLLGLFIL